ncbi:MAG: hypothetical protein NVS2B12_19050 [Ktedonobacteraceae bacterium]
MLQRGITDGISLGHIDPYILADIVDGRHSSILQVYCYDTFDTFMPGYTRTYASIDGYTHQSTDNIAQFMLVRA